MTTIESVEDAVKRTWNKLGNTLPAPRHYIPVHSTCQYCGIERDNLGIIIHEDDCPYFSAIDIDRMTNTGNPNVVLENGFVISGEERIKIFVPYMPKELVA